MSHCHVCSGTRVEMVLDLGRQPVSSHFTAGPGVPVVMHPLELGVCHDCGVIVLMRPWPFQDLVPPFEWITYREPEAHLDAVADAICAAPGVGKDARIVGLTYKDRTTLDRLTRLGFADTRIIDARRDLGATHPFANIETVHGLLSPEKALALAHTHGAADVLIARHILEHAENAQRFLAALGNLLRPDGHLVIEVPEVSGNLARQDYAMIWEEHNAYFLPELLPGVLDRAGFELLRLDRTALPFEDIVVAHARRRSGATGRARAPSQSAAVQASVTAARAYGKAYSGWTARYQRLCEELTCDGRQLAAYGAGHLTCAFLHFHDLARYFAFVVDDTPHKQGLHLPHSGLPIVSRRELDARRIALCLFGFAPEIEAKVEAGNQAYVAAGGRFASMFADSPRALRTVHKLSAP